MDQLKPMQIVNYGVGATAGKLAERGVRGLFGAVKRHPRVTRGAGLVGVGYLTAKELERRRKRKLGYQMNARYFTPDVKLGLKERFKQRLAERKPTKKGFAGVGKRLGGTASMAVKTALIGLAAKEVLDLLASRKTRAPWMPEIRSDIELGNYAILDQVVEYASMMPNKMLKIIQTKAGAALRKTKRGVERGFLLWLLGFISSEMLGRGISKPQRRHEVTFPKGKSYMKKLSKVDSLPGGFQPFTPPKTGKRYRPKKWGPYVPVGAKPKRKLGRKIGPLAALPIAALLAIRLSERRQEGYSFKSAAKRTLRGMKKAGGTIGKVGGAAGQAAFIGLMVSELWPRKRKRPAHPPVQSPAYPYGLAKGLKQLLKLKKVKTPPAVGHKLRDLTLSRRDPALANLNRRLAAAAQKRRKFQLVEEYPFRSAAQRRWMHWKKPKMAAEWEEHTPEGKKLPEHVSKHLLGVPILTPLIIAKILADRKRKKEQYVLSPRKARRVMRRAHADQINAGVRDAIARWRRDPRRKGVNRFILGASLLAAIPPTLIVMRSRRKEREHVSKHALSVPWALKRARDLMRLKGAKPQGREVVSWARKMAKTLRTAQLKTTDVKRKVELGARAGKWETVADQVGDVIGRAQLEKIGLLAAATTAAGVAAHEVGKKRERARVHRVVG